MICVCRLRSPSAADRTGTTPRTEPASSCGDEPEGVAVGTNEAGGDVVFGSVTVPAGDLRWRFSRSSGPGGQHVNTSATRVSLSVDVTSCRGLGRTRRERALERLSGRLVDGVLTVSVQEHRSQARNRGEAMERM